MTFMILGGVVAVVALAATLVARQLFKEAHQ